MTRDQALGIWQGVLAAFPAQEIETPTHALYLEYLSAIPWREGRTEAAIRALIGRQETAFLPPIGAIVGAAGVHGDAVAQLVEAMRRGEELVPDLASMTGWAVGVAVRPLPLPMTDSAPALPAPANGRGAVS